MAMAAMGDRNRFRKWIDLIERMHGQSAPGYFFVDHFYQFLNDTMLSRMSDKNIEQVKSLWFEKTNNVARKIIKGKEKIIS